MIPSSGVLVVAGLRLWQRNWVLKGVGLWLLVHLVGAAIG